MFIKRKEFEELKNRVEVLEFQRDNPLGLELRITADEPFCGYWALFYVKDGHIEKLKLSHDTCNRWELLSDNTLRETKHEWFDTWTTLYKFDEIAEKIMAIDVKHTNVNNAKKTEAVEK